MKTLKITVLFLLFTSQLFAQLAGNTLTSNIVPNPGFEKYSTTPIGWFYKGKHFTNVVKYWSSATAASPDVFGPKVRVPAHWASKGFGDQKARSGGSMAGITVYGCEEGKPHCREYVQIQLSEPLVIGQKYYAEFWVNHLARSLQVNNIGLFFSENEMDIILDAPIDTIPHIVAKDIVATYGSTWKKISGTFTATTEAAYMIVGNFQSDSLTQVAQRNPNQLNYAYYYLDDILVKKENPIIKVPIKEGDLCCIDIEEGKVFQLKNIFFDTDKSELLPRSYVELNKLLNLMRDNPTMVIEISGHTDIIGDYNYNLFLSKRRAKAVVDYLIGGGISPARTLYRGYGSTKPIASNDDENGRQLNRRVEFLVIKK